MNNVTAIKLRPRSFLLLGACAVFTAVAVGWPLLVTPKSTVAHGADAPFVFALLLPLVLAVVVVELFEGGMDAKAVAMLGVLAAIGAALRALGAGAAGIETVFFMLVLAGRVFGPGFGFALGGLTLVTSALLTGGVGPWLPYQMLAAAWFGFGAGLLPYLKGRWEIVMLGFYGAAASLSYGVLMNLSFWPFIVGPSTELSLQPGDGVLENLTRFFAFSLTTSLGWDLGRAITTALLIALTGGAILRAFRRVARRGYFAEAVTPISPTQAETVSHHK